MSINHLYSTTEGEGFHIGCLELVSENPILLNNKALISVKQNLTEESVSPKILWGEVTEYTAGQGGTVPDAFNFYWDASQAGRCYVTVPTSTNLTRNGEPIIMVNTRNTVGDYTHPNLGGYCFCAKLINSYTIELDFYSFVAIGNRPFCLAIIY